MRKVFKRKVQGKLTISVEGEAAAGRGDQINLSLYEGENILGKDPRQCDILLNLKEISSVHCKITINSIDDYTIEDMGSEAGVFKYNKNFIEDPYQKLRPGKEYELAENKPFYIARYKCLFISKNSEELKKSIKEKVDQKDIAMISFKNWVENCRQSYREKSIAEGGNSEISDVSENLEELVKKTYKKKPGPKAKELMMQEDEEEERRLRNVNKKDDFISTETMQPYKKLFNSKKHSFENKNQMDEENLSEENFLDIKRMDSFERKYVNRSLVLTSSREERMQLREKRVGVAQFNIIHEAENKLSEHAEIKNSKVIQKNNISKNQGNLSEKMPAPEPRTRLSANNRAEENLNNKPEQKKFQLDKTVQSRSGAIQTRLSPYLTKAKKQEGKKRTMSHYDNEALDELSETLSEKETRIKRTRPSANTSNNLVEKKSNIVLQATPQKKKIKNTEQVITTPGESVSELNMSLSARLRRKRDEGGDTPDRDELLAYALQLLGEDVMAPILKNPALPKEHSKSLSLYMKEKEKKNSGEEKSDLKNSSKNLNSLKNQNLNTKKNAALNAPRNAGINTSKLVKNSSPEKMELEKKPIASKTKHISAQEEKNSPVQEIKKVPSTRKSGPQNKDMQKNTYEKPSFRIPISVDEISKSEDFSKKGIRVVDNEIIREVRTRAGGKFDVNSTSANKLNTANGKRRAANKLEELSPSTYDLNKTINKILSENEGRPILKSKASINKGQDPVSIRKKRKLNSDDYLAGGEKSLHEMNEGELDQKGLRNYQSLRDTKKTHSKILLKEKKKRSLIELKNLEGALPNELLPKRNSYSVLFSCYKPDENTKKRLKSLGLVTVDSPKNNFNVLVVDKTFRRTVKLLIAICKGAIIVSKEWIDEILKSSLVIDPADFILKDPAAEKRFNFNLIKSLQASDKAGNNFLANLKFWFPGHVRPDYRELEMLVISGGGKVIVNRPRVQEKDVIVLLDKYDERNIERFVSNGITPYQVELILAGCLRQKLEFNKYRLLS